MRKNDCRKYKLVFVGGALDHIFLPLILELYKIYGNDFLYVCCGEIPTSRIQIGYDYSKLTFPFMKKMFISKGNYNECLSFVNTANVVLWGGCLTNKLVKSRLKTNKITFRLTERLFKTETTINNFVRRFFGTLYHYRFAKKANKFVLCMGGYVAEDFHTVKLFSGKMLNWGYFTSSTSLSFDELVKIKNLNHTIELTWIGRFILLKQPFMVLNLAIFLRSLHINFHISMGGYGELLDSCNDFITKNKLENYVTLTGALSLEEKENLLNRTNIFLFTSTREEGWGAVVNESMGSGCICIASRESGASKALIRHAKNGFLFNSNLQDEFNKLVYDCIENYGKLIGLQKAAYEEIHNVWNHFVAANNLAAFIDNLLENNIIKYAKSGPCSNAEIKSP